MKIIADDLGLAGSVNDGIVFLLKNNKIDGASLMANGEAFDDVIEKTREFKDKIGIHFVLVEEKSVFNGAWLEKNYKQFFLKYCSGLIKIKDIENELRAQIEKVKNAGLTPVFINSHQHLHLLPGVIDIVIRIARESGIKYVRLVKEPIHGRGKLFRKFQLVFLGLLSYLAKRKLIRAGLIFNDVFLGFIDAGNLNQEDIDLAKSINGGMVELGCHPGFGDEELKKKYNHWGNYNWKKELDLLSQ